MTLLPNPCNAKLLLHASKALAREHSVTGYKPPSGKKSAHQKSLRRHDVLETEYKALNTSRYTSERCFSEKFFLEGISE